MVSNFIKATIFSVALLFIHSHSVAQLIELTDPVEEYIRLLRTDENSSAFPSFQLWPVDASILFSEDYKTIANPWSNLVERYRFKTYRNLKYRIKQPRLFTSFNSRLPSGHNDGALWQGRGINNSFEFGAELRYKFLSLSFYPQITYSQNKSFPLSKHSPFRNHSKFATAHSYSAFIDRPQRFGESSQSGAKLGNSHIDIRHSGFKAGLSTSNLWTGPALHNPIIFSNNAAGFRHLYAGTYRPVKTPIGSFEGIFLGGWLSESDYFDSIEENDKRFLNAATLIYGPSFIPGFYMGATRMIQKYTPEGGVGASDFFEVFQPFLKDNLRTEENPSGNLESHQLMTLMFNWTFPQYGFELYSEWSRNDHSGDERDLLRHFEHARGYMLGFIKKFELSGGRWFTANTEITQLEVPRLNQFRRTGSYYNNGEIPQGFTNQGQILGSHIGPGSNSQIISLKLYDSWGLAGVSLNRIVHHNDRLYRLYRLGLLNSNTEPWRLHMTEFRFGLHYIYLKLKESLVLESNIYYSRFLNYDYQLQNSLNNINLQLSVSYIF